QPRADAGGLGEEPVEARHVVLADLEALHQPQVGRLQFPGGHTVQPGQGDDGAAVERAARHHTAPVEGDGLACRCSSPDVLPGHACEFLSPAATAGVSGSLRLVLCEPCSLRNQAKKMTTNAIPKSNRRAPFLIPPASVCSSMTPNPNACV